MADRETRASAFAAAIRIVLTDPEHARRAVSLCADDRVRELASVTVRTYRDGTETLDPDTFTV